MRSVSDKIASFLKPPTTLFTKISSSLGAFGEEEEFKQNLRTASTYITPILRTYGLSSIMRSLVKQKAGYLEKEAHQMPMGPSGNAGNDAKNSTNMLGSRHDTVVHLRSLSKN